MILVGVLFLLALPIVQSLNYTLVGNVTTHHANISTIIPDFAYINTVSFTTCEHLDIICSDETSISFESWIVNTVNCGTFNAVCPIILCEQELSAQSSPVTTSNTYTFSCSSDDLSVSTIISVMYAVIKYTNNQSTMATFSDVQLTYGLAAPYLYTVTYISLLCIFVLISIRFIIPPDLNSREPIDPRPGLTILVVMGTDAIWGYCLYCIIGDIASIGYYISTCIVVGVASMPLSLIANALTQYICLWIRHQCRDCQIAAHLRSPDTTTQTHTLTGISIEIPEPVRNNREQVRLNNLCHICRISPADCILWTCRHKCCCMVCASALKISQNPFCPLCGIRVENIMTDV